MSLASNNEREEQALDALIVAAFRQDPSEDDALFDINGPEPVLSEEDERALEALGADLPARIADGWRPSPRDQANETVVDESELLVAGAMHRGGEEGDLSDRARDEIERRIRDLEAAGPGTSPQAAVARGPRAARRQKELAEIEHEAEVILAAHEITSFPIDPMAIAELERIVLVPGDFDGCFDGRIEYRRQAGAGRFYLFYAEEHPPDRPLGRVRFSVAHELGHFYLPEHREYLISGVWHGSHAGFVSDKPVEREADHFATALLMPSREFKRRVSMNSRGVCTLRDLVTFANEVFQTSLSSTAIRYAQLNFEPCSVILSRDGQVLFSIRSDDMRRLGLGWLTKGTRIPAASVTGRVLAAPPGEKTVKTKGQTDSDVWFESNRPFSLWEEVKVLGQTGLTLTFLALDEDSDEE